MRIDLAKGREDYFIRPTVKEMFNARGDPRQRANSINRLGRLAARDPNAVLWGATGANSLEDLTERGPFLGDKRNTIRRVFESSGDELIVLPPQYRIAGKDTQLVMSYFDSSLVRLDHPRVLMGLLGSDYRRSSDGRFDFVELCNESLTPDMLLREAFGLLAGTNEDQRRFAYAWQSPHDGGLRVVNPLRAIEAAEIKMYQDHVAFLTLAEKYSRSNNPNEKAKGERMFKRIDDLNAYEVLEHLHPGKFDLIQRVFRAHNHRTGWMMRTPSREYPDQIHQISLEDMPILRRGHIERQLMFGFNLKVYDNSVSKDNKKLGSEQAVRQWRRTPEGQLSSPDIFYTANAIAAAHSLRTTYKYFPGGFACGVLPFIIPRRELVELADTLRYRTVVLDRKKSGYKAGEWELKSLNKTEISDLLMHAISVIGYDRLCSADPSNIGLRDDKAAVSFYKGDRNLAA